MGATKGFFETLPKLQGANLWVALAAFFGLLIFLLAWRWIAPGSYRLALEREERQRAHRVEALWADLMFYARHQRQQIISLAILGDTKPDYVLQRLKDLKDEECPLDDWQKEVDGLINPTNQIPPANP